MCGQEAGSAPRRAAAAAAAAAAASPPDPPQPAPRPLALRAHHGLVLALRRVAPPLHLLLDRLDGLAVLDGQLLVDRVDHRLADCGRAAREGRRSAAAARGARRRTRRRRGVGASLAHPRSHARPPSWAHSRSWTGFLLEDSTSATGGVNHSSSSRWMLRKVVAVRRVPVARLCGGALASTATIGAARGRSVTPTVPCDAPGQRRVECTNDHCKWA